MKITPGTIISSAAIIGGISGGALYHDNEGRAMKNLCNHVSTSLSTPELKEGNVSIIQKYCENFERENQKPDWAAEIYLAQAQKDTKKLQEKMLQYKHLLVKSAEENDEFEEILDCIKNNTNNWFLRLSFFVGLGATALACFAGLIGLLSTYLDIRDWR